MIRKLIALVGLAVAGSVAFAQTGSTSAGGLILNAYGFAYGAPNGPQALQVTSGSNTSGTYTITLAFGSVTTAQGIKFNPFKTCVSTNTCAPINIGGGTANETVTPSSANCSTPDVINTCTVTATFANAHSNGDIVRTGDYGLQEAAMYAVGQGGGLVALSPQWFSALGGHAAGLTALVGFRSLATTTYTVLDYSGVAGALSYAAASGSVYASTTHVLY